MKAGRGALVLAALAGASAWISFGTLAVTSDRGARIGAVAPLWVLLAFVIVAVVTAWVARLETSDALPLALTTVLWLPWLPLTVPAAFLVWEGPAEVPVWCAALGGVIVARRWPSAWRPAVLLDPNRAPWVIAGVVFVCSIATAAALTEQLPGGDEPHYLIITQSLLYDGDLRIRNNHDRGDYLQYHNDGLPPDFLKRGLDGQIYSIHAPGLSALLLPAFAIAGYPGAVVMIALLCAGAIGVSWQTMYRLTSSRAAAWAGTLAAAFSATFFFHSFAIFPDPVGAVITAMVLRVVVETHTSPERMRRWHWMVAGSALGVLPWLHTRFALLAAAFGVVIAARLWTRRDRWSSLLAFSGIPVALAVGWFAFFWVIYGTPNPSAPYGDSQQNALEWIGRGLSGLAFDQQFGLVTAAPVMAFLPYGLLLMWRSSRRLTAEILLVAVPYGLVVASFGMWWGGWSAPARFLVPLIPLAIPLLGLAWQHGTVAVRCAFTALVLVGGVNIVARIIVLDGLLVYNFRDGFDLLLDWMSRTANLPLALPSIHRSGVELTMMVAAIWITAGAMGLLVMSLVLRDRVRSRGAQWAVTGLVGLTVTAIAMSASWKVARVSPLTPESSEVEFVRRWEPARRPIAVELPRLDVVPVRAALDRIELQSSTRAREVNESRALLALPWVPAGEYRITMEGAQSLAGVLTVSVGMTAQNVETWSLDGRPARDPGLHLRLPALAHSVVVRGDAVAKSRITRVALHPVEIDAGAQSHDVHVIRATRYGPVRAYFLDDSAFVEPDGVWTRGNSIARMVLRSDAASVALDVQAGPIPSVVDLRSGDWSEHVELTAGERRRIDVPLAGALTVQTTGAFRPIDHDPGTRDARLLGARLEFAAGPTRP